MLKTLNEVYSARSMKRRYEVWFLRVGLADGSGAWWFRYLLMNPGRLGCKAHPQGMPVQVWATWFPRDADPQHWIRGFPLQELTLSSRHRSPFTFSAGGNFIDEQSCRGQMSVGGHEIRWDLRYHSHFRASLSNKGWIGFSRTPHSDARFSGEIRLDGRIFRGEPLGTGVQGHNCGFRHRNFWTWTHAVFANPDGPLSTLEALVYEMPMGLVFRKALLWHGAEILQFKDFREELRNRDSLEWRFRAPGKNGGQIEVTIDGTGRSVHRLPYLKTDCSASFEVANNSLANARVALARPGQPTVLLETHGGAVLEMVGDP
jgi:hypothetical protein